MFRRIRFLLAVLLMVDALPVGAVATPALTPILNQASATYLDTFRGVSARSVSNVSRVQVRAVSAATLTTDNTRRARSGQFVSLPHTLVNTGNATDQFLLSLLQAPDDSFDVQRLTLYHDINENGVADAGEPALAGAVTLGAGAHMPLVVAGRIPSAQANGMTARLRLTIASTRQHNRTLAQRTDHLIISESAQLQLSKRAQVSCAEALQPGADIRYTISVSNVSPLGLEAGVHKVDGETLSGILAIDPVPANTRLVADSMTAVPASARRVVQLADMPDDEWLSVERWNRSAAPSRVGLLIPPEALRANSSARWTFSVTINEGVTGGARITNTAGVDSDGDGEADQFSNAVCNTVAADAPGSRVELRFLAAVGEIAVDTADERRFETAGRYRLDSAPGYDLARDGVYLEIRASMLNLDSTTLDDRRTDGSPLTVLVRSTLTGDSVYVEVVETAPNSGIFRSRSPLRLSTADRAGAGLCGSSGVGCVLSSGRNDELRATVLDHDGRTELADLAVVDPFGVVFDSVTGRPVAGATVNVRNLDGSLAIDPFADGSAALAPQVTGTDGRYAFPFVYPGQYYLDVVPPDGYRSPSVAPAETFAGRFAVADFSYGRGGFHRSRNEGVFDLQAGDPPLIIDVPVDPLPRQVGLRMDKTALAGQAEVGDVVPYRIRVRNVADAVLLDTRVEDRPPRGFRYVAGSAWLDPGDVREPATSPDGTLTFSLGRLASGEERTLEYLMRVGPNAAVGANVNSARARAQSGGGVPADTAVVTSSVRVSRDGLLSSHAFLIGRVFADRDCDQAFGDDDWPVAGARLYLDDGRYVLTDSAGRYSFYGLEPGRRALRLDDSTLPPGTAGFVDRVPTAGLQRVLAFTPGDLQRANFSIDCAVPQAAALHQALQARAEARRVDERAGKPAAEPVRHGRKDSASRVVMGAAPSLSAAAPPSALDSIGQIDPQVAARAATAEMARSGTWLWPQGEVARDGQVMVVVRAGIEPTLLIDGQPVAEEQLGARIANPASGAQVLAWYGLTLPHGLSRLEVVGDDAFGNRRVLAAREVYRPGLPHRLLLASETPSGLGGVTLRIELVDANGVTVSGAEFVTLDTSAGRWRDTDLQPGSPGHQIRLGDGMARADLLTADGTTAARVRATYADTMTSDIDVRLAAPARDLLGVGLIDFSHTRGHGDADYEHAAAGSGGLDAALFLTGRVRGDAHLSLAYDSDARRDEAAFRDLDPERYYSIYGDAATQGFEAQSRGRLYARLERGADSMMWGDFRTDDVAGPRLGRVSYALSGASAFVQRGALGVSAFAARDHYHRRTEELSGNGTASDYRLAGTPVVANSESIVIVTRLRDHPGVVVDESRLTRFVDYTLNERTGELLFHEPLPSTDPNGNPLAARVVYNTEARGRSYAIAGASGSWRLADGAEISASLVADESPEAGFDLAAAALSLASGGRHDVQVEAASLRRVDGAAGNAGTLSWQAEWTDTTSTEVRYARASSEFVNPGSPVSAGREEAIAEARHQWLASTELLAQLNLSRSFADRLEQRSALVEARHRLGAWRGGLGWRALSRSDEAGETASQAVRVASGYAFEVFGRSATLDTELEQALSGDGTLTRTTAAMQVFDGSKLYARHDYSNGANVLGGAARPAARSSLVLGAESNFTAGLRGYSELHQRGGSANRAMEAVNGIRGTVELSPGLRLSPSAEYVHPLGAGQSGFALSVGISDDRDEEVSRRLRVETRRSQQGRHLAARGVLVHRLNDAWTALLREDYSRRSASEATTYDHALSAALAYRPSRSDRHHSLAAYQWKRSGDPLDGGHTTYLLSAHHNYRSELGWTLSGRLGGKFQASRFHGKSFTSRLLMADARLTHRLGARWDVSVHAGLATDGQRSSHHALGLGGGFRIADTIRVGVRYNWRGFREEDLDAESRNARGLTLGLQMAVSEDLFGWLQPGR